MSFSNNWIHLLLLHLAHIHIILCYFCLFLLVRSNQLYDYYYSTWKRRRGGGLEPFPNVVTSISQVLFPFLFRDTTAWHLIKEKSRKLIEVINFSVLSSMKEAQVKNLLHILSLYVFLS